MTQTLEHERSAIADAIAARVHIGADAGLSIDLRGGSLTHARITTDIRCPKCGGSLVVDEIDTDVHAAQLRCHGCFLTFLQRLRDERRPMAKPHRWIDRTTVEPTSF